MNADVLILSWFDYLTVLILLLGIFYSRKHPVGEEIFHTCKWLLVVIVCSYTYKPLGQLVAKFTGFNMFLSYVGGYLISLCWIIVLFAYIRRWLGERILAFNIFGSAEHYFSMVTGAARYACILLVGLSLLNAKDVGQAQVYSEIKMQVDNFGQVSLPTIGLLQQGVFEESMTGYFIKTHFPAQLISPVRALKEKDSRRKDRPGPLFGLGIPHSIPLLPIG